MEYVPYWLPVQNSDPYSSLDHGRMGHCHDPYVSRKNL